jgi:hypothetical protein
MNRSEIVKSIAKAKKGISQYIEIMDLVTNVNVTLNRDFQKKYNAFYRVRQRSANWYASYYALMEELKSVTPTFDEVINRLSVTTGRYEPSFSSKLVATIRPEKPIWDVHILNNTGHSAPSYSARDKFQLAKKAYESIEKWYEGFIKSDDGKIYIEVFDETILEHKKITDLKKIDFILWQTRSK